MPGGVEGSPQELYNERGQVKDPEIAQEMAKVEKPFREKKVLGIFKPSNKRIKEGEQRAENLGKDLRIEKEDKNGLGSAQHKQNGQENLAATEQGELIDDIIPISVSCENRTNVRDPECMNNPELIRYSLERHAKQRLGESWKEKVKSFNIHLTVEDNLARNGNVFIYSDQVIMKDGTVVELGVGRTPDLSFF
ncbi:MAG: hypothetical protein NTY30_01870 [Candidatus Berkelbacteria bacterium]|nr:hypothetical protein [Candidatus Berkelbacteria bacterium]